MTLCKISGYGAMRKVEVIACEEFLDLDEKQFARRIASKYHEYPALTIGVDADGAGRTVILELEEIGIPVERDTLGPALSYWSGSETLHKFESLCPLQVAGSNI